MRRKNAYNGRYAVSGKPRFQWAIPAVVLLAIGSAVAFFLIEKPVLQEARQESTGIPEALTEAEVAQTTVPVVAEPKTGTVLHDLDGDGNAEKLYFQDGILHRVFAVEGQEERLIFEDSTSFLCDDGKTIVQFSEGSGGHTLFYYQLIHGELESQECLVYHYADGRYFRSLDHSAANGSLVELTEEEYRQAMEAFPCTDGEDSFLGHLF